MRFLVDVESAPQNEEYRPKRFHVTPELAANEVPERWVQAS